VSETIASFSMDDCDYGNYVKLQERILKIMVETKTKVLKVIIIIITLHEFVCVVYKNLYTGIIY